MLALGRRNIFFLKKNINEHLHPGEVLVRISLKCEKNNYSFSGSNGESFLSILVASFGSTAERIEKNNIPPAIPRHKIIPIVVIHKIAKKIPPLYDVYAWK